MENEEEKEIKRQADELAKELEPLFQQLNGLNNQAVAAYAPLVDDICSRKATEKEVGWLLTWMLDFAGNERMLKLYKRVCRAYWQSYPETVAYYIMDCAISDGTIMPSSICAVSNGTISPYLDMSV